MFGAIIMTNPRKKIILNEILFWKQNKLLPEHYCDFLAALYTEGADIEELEPVQHPKQAILPSEKRKNGPISSGSMYRHHGCFDTLFYNAIFDFDINCGCGIRGMHLIYCCMANGTKNIYWRLFFMYWQPFCYLVCLFVFALHILVEIIRFCFV